MRRAWMVAALALLVAAATPFPRHAAGSSAAPKTKLSPALRALVGSGGYGSFPIDSVVPGHRPGRVYYLAQLEGGIETAALRDLRRVGAVVRHRYPSIGWVALSSSLPTLKRIAGLGLVRRLEIDRVHNVHGVTVQAAPRRFGDQSKRGTRDIGADAAWAGKREWGVPAVTGGGVTIGVADSGIDAAHPDVGGPKLAAFRDCQAVPDEGVPCVPAIGYDDNGHGTHVSGIAAGSGAALPGVAPEAALAGAKVCLAAGSCLNSAVMAGLQWLATEREDGGAGADVINVSLGSGRSYFAPFEGAQQVTNEDPEAVLVNTLAQQNNVVFTISAGNSGPVLQSTGSPAVASQAIAVGASITDWDLGRPVAQTLHGEFGNVRPAAAKAHASAIASFSSRGPTGDRQLKPELTAPGSYYVAAEATEGAEIRAADIAHAHHYSSDPMYAVLSGTSMSAPAAAGAAALVIDGYRQVTEGSPAYFQVKAALANTAGTRAFEGPIVGLIGGIRAKHTGAKPEDLYPMRNNAWVGVTGEGAGRIHVPSAVFAITRGVIVYSPQVGKLDNVHELQPNWAMDDLAAGDAVSRTFVLHPAPGLGGPVATSFAVESGPEAAGIRPAPASWFRLPGPVTTAPGKDSLFTLGLQLPPKLDPGIYTATVVATTAVGKVTQRLRVPVQFFVELRDPNLRPGGVVLRGPIWAAAGTDYSAIGALHPLEDVHTDWAMFPVRLSALTGRVVLTIGGPAMDVFAFDRKGREIDSSVSTGSDRVVLFDGDDWQKVSVPSTIWIVVSYTDPGTAPNFATYQLGVDVIEVAG